MEPAGTPGNKICMQHMLGDWTGPIEGCNCPSCMGSKHSEDEDEETKHTKKYQKTSHLIKQKNRHFSQEWKQCLNVDMRDVDKERDNSLTIIKEGKNIKFSLDPLSIGVETMQGDILTRKSTECGAGDMKLVFESDLVSCLSETQAVKLCGESVRVLGYVDKDEGIVVSSGSAMVGEENEGGLILEEGFINAVLPATVQVLDGVTAELGDSAKEACEVDAFLKPSEDMHPGTVPSVKEEPLEYSLSPQAEEDDDDDGLGDISIEVTNADFMEVFDKALGDVSAMFKKLQDDPLNHVECTVCFKKIKESSMKQHFRTHAGLRPHPCDICGTRFTRKGDVYRHKKVVHGKMKPYICKKCHKKFPDRNLLVLHLQNHDKAVYYECKTCGYKFGKKEYYENHTRYIHPCNDTPKPIIDEGESDIVESQLKELEEDDIITGSSQVHRNFSKKSIKNENMLPVSNIDEDEEILNDVDEPSTPPTSSSPTNSDCTALVPSVQLQTVSKTDSKDEDLVNKILDAAVAQATNTLENLASDKQMRKFQYQRTQPKQKPMEIIIKASVSGQMQRFIIQIQTESPIDLQSETGMELIVNMVNQLVGGGGQLDGPIEVELHNQS